MELGKSQKADVLRYLKDHPVRGITDEEARQMFGAHRLGAIICDLRKEGHNIRTDKLKGRNRYGHAYKCAVYRYIG